MSKKATSFDWIFDSSISFEDRSSKVFKYQFENNSIYRRFSETFGVRNSTQITPDKIPLLPIRAFKDAKIIVNSSNQNPDLVFRSSGTSGMEKSLHYVLQQEIYQTSILLEFQKHFPFDDFAIAFFLPGYEDNPQSSLIWMARHLIHSDPSGESRFISSQEAFDLKSHFNSVLNKKKILIFGAAFGLLDLIESGKINPVKNLHILETGGMKTHRREMSKTELRNALSQGFKIPLSQIHSEYGMCELLSQMYAIGSEWLKSPHWVDVSVRDPKNPLRISDTGEEGKIGIIDLANINSCPFILTDDRGVMDASDRFKVLGRWNPNDLRGCNFLIDRE